MDDSHGEKAIRHLEAALAGPLEGGAATEVRARLATLYATRREGSRADNLERAIELSRRALAETDPRADPQAWGNAQHNLGSAFVERLRGEKADNVEQAIAHLEEALRVRTREADPERWAATQNNLGSAFRERVVADPSENVERAIEHVQSALEVRTRVALPREWAVSQNDLAIAYLARLRGDPSENVEQAIHYLELALEVHTQETATDRWAEAHSNLAFAFSRRVKGGRAENLSRAVLHAESALEAYDPVEQLLERANIHNSLGVIYRELAGTGEEAASDRSIQHLEAVLELLPREDFPDRWAGAHLNLLGSYLRRRNGELLVNLRAAIEHGQRALEVYNRETYPDRWAMAHQNLGLAALELDRLEEADHASVAEDHFRQALEIFSRDRFTARHRVVQRSLGDLFFERGEWADAHDAYTAAIAAGDDLLEEAYTDEGLSEELGEAAILFARDAYCLLELGRPDDALARLDRGKARLLSEALMLSDVAQLTLSAERREELARLRGTLRALELEARTQSEADGARRGREVAGKLRRARGELRMLVAALREADPDLFPTGLEVEDLAGLVPSGGALVAPIITSQGSVALVLRDGRDTIEEDGIVQLGEFTDHHLELLLFGSPALPEWGGWLGAYLRRDEDPAARRGMIEAAGMILWSRLVGPLRDGLAAAGVERGAPLVVFPQGGLGLLPLHTAFHFADGRRCALIDDHPVSYAPGGYALAAGLRRLRTLGPDRSLAAVANPTGDLEYAAAEGWAVQARFPPGKASVLADATLDDVLREVPGRTHLHFACHGEYAWADPMQSALLLAGDEPLTVATAIARLDLRAARLVTLSACETGMTDARRSPDEYVGLPAALLQAEAPAVVSTLWSVDDFSTMLLMERFYELQASPTVSASRALACAQRWLRDATNEELSERVRELRERAEADGLSVELVRRHYRRLTLAEPGERPFEELYYWGAFGYWGADATDAPAAGA